MRKVKVWGAWGDPHTVKINSEGTIDETAKLVFTRGQCHSLALAIYELVDCGWPMFGLGNPKNNKPSSPGHVVIRRPKNGAYIDINGPGALERWRKKFGNDLELYPLTSEMIMAGLEGFLPVDVKAAKPFAKTLLKEHCNVKHSSE